MRRPLLPHAAIGSLLACALSLACRRQAPAPSTSSAEDWTARGWRVVEPADADPRVREPPPTDEHDAAPKQDKQRSPGIGGGLNEDTEPCIPNPEAQRECEAKPGWIYGPHPHVRCKGTAPRPGETQAIQESIRDSPCECYDPEEVAERRRACGRVR